MKGMVEGGTRSGLLYEVTRLLKQTPDEEKPKFLLMENVKNLVGKQFKPQFDELCEFLEKLGYNNYWEVMNAKNTGIPQNRERVFMLSIRKDIDNEQFTFPKPFDNGVRLKDVLFDKVDDKYYITCDRAKVLIEKLVESDKINMGGCDLSVNQPQPRDVSNCISARTDRGISNRRQEGTGVCVKIKS